MKFFKVNLGLKSMKLPLFRIVISILLFVLCYNRNRIIPTENKILTSLGTVVTVGVIVIGFYCIFISVTEIIEMKSKKKDPSDLPPFEKRDWTTEKLFSFLEESDIIDIVVEHAGSRLKIGTKSDYGRTNRFSSEKSFFDKCYYIEEAEYEKLSDFIEQFQTVIQADVVTILYVGIDDMPLDRL